MYNITQPLLAVALPDDRDIDAETHQWGAQRVSALDIYHNLFDIAAAVLRRCTDPMLSNYCWRQLRYQQGTTINIYSHLGL